MPEFTRVTPLTLSILLHIYYSPSPLPVPHSSSRVESIRWLEEEGFIVATENRYKTTPRAKRWIEKLCTYEHEEPTFTVVFHTSPPRREEYYEEREAVEAAMTYREAFLKIEVAKNDTLILARYPSPE